mmetsp:Transcript_127515/g.408136  ORF Transcript_127515/g.408136 Transcript_127515/m.408136 type:complete len:243 (-) Transcript_127515:62-790(-)
MWKCRSSEEASSKTSTPGLAHPPAPPPLRPPRAAPSRASVASRCERSAMAAAVAAELPSPSPILEAGLDGASSHVWDGRCPSDQQAGSRHHRRGTSARRPAAQPPPWVVRSRHRLAPVPLGSATSAAPPAVGGRGSPPPRRPTAGAAAGAADGSGVGVEMARASSSNNSASSSDKPLQSTPPCACPRAAAVGAAAPLEGCMAASKLLGALRLHPMPPPSPPRSRRINSPAPPWPFVRTCARG